MLMRNFWISWYQPVTDDSTEFELHSPWWVSGYAPMPGTTRQDIEDETAQWLDMYCAAVQAESEDAAKEMIFACYDVRPPDLAFRFCEPRDVTWTPFCGRFPKADWMVWNADA